MNWGHVLVLASVVLGCGWGVLNIQLAVRQSDASRSTREVLALTGVMLLGVTAYGFGLAMAAWK